MLLQVIRETSCYIDHESGVNIYTLVEGDLAVAIGPVGRASTLYWQVITRHGIVDVYMSSFKVIHRSNDDTDEHNFKILKVMWYSVTCESCP